MARDDDREEEKILDDLVSDAIGEVGPDPYAPRVDSAERIVRVTPVPIVIFLLAGAATGGFFIYRNVSALKKEVHAATQERLDMAEESPLETLPPAPRFIEQPPRGVEDSIPPAVRRPERELPAQSRPVVREDRKRPKPRAKPAPVVKSPEKVSVQVGGFATTTYYNMAVREVRKVGYEPTTLRKNVGVGAYEIRIGPFREREDAELVRRNLPEHGFAPSEMSLRTFRNKDDTRFYFVTLEEVREKSDLDSKIEKLQSLSLPYKVADQAGGEGLLVVQVDNLSRKSAEGLMTKLRAKGYDPKILD